MVLFTLDRIKLNLASSHPNNNNNVTAENWKSQLLVFLIVPHNDQLSQQRWPRVSNYATTKPLGALHRKHNHDRGRGGKNRVQIVFLKIIKINQKQEKGKVWKRAKVRLDTQSSPAHYYKPSRWRFRRLLSQPRQHLPVVCRRGGFSWKKKPTLRGRSRALYWYHGVFLTQRKVNPASVRILIEAASASRTVSLTDCMRFWALWTNISVACKEETFHNRF